MRKNDPEPMPLMDALFYTTVTEGTRLMELALGVSLLGDGFLVMMTKHGVNAVPFLSSSLASLAWPQWVWTVALTLLGLVTLRGWFHSQRAAWGRIRRWDKPPPYRMQEIVQEPMLAFRAAAMTLQAVLWAIITAAISTGPPPAIVALRYGRTLFFSSICAAMLWAQWDYSRKRQEHDSPGGDDVQ